MMHGQKNIKLNPWLCSLMWQAQFQLTVYL